MQYIARMQFSWKIIVSLILAFIVQISWAANSEELNGKTDFCGVQIKFSGKPKIDNNTKWLSEILGPYDKYTISALSYSGYKLFELAACICREDTVSEMVIFGGISPSKTAINHKKRNK